MADFWGTFLKVDDDPTLTKLQAALARTFAHPANPRARKARDKATAALLEYARAHGRVGAIDLNAGIVD